MLIAAARVKEMAAQKRIHRCQPSAAYSPEKWTAERELENHGGHSREVGQISYEAQGHCSHGNWTFGETLRWKHGRPAVAEYLQSVRRRSVRCA